MLWDQHSFPRYRFSLDDDVLFLRDIVLERPKSLFDNFYLGFMRDLRDRYGTKTHINIYYAYEDFDLRQMPDTYKSEWRDNADWLQLSFHARTDHPRDPYKEASAEKTSYGLPAGARRDAALLRARIAGRTSLRFTGAKAPAWAAARCARRVSGAWRATSFPPRTCA